MDVSISVIAFFPLRKRDSYWTMKLLGVFTEKNTNVVSSDLNLPLISSVTSGKSFSEHNL